MSGLEQIANAVTLNIRITEFDSSEKLLQLKKELK